MQKMIDFKKDAIPESTVKRVGAIMSSEDFTLEKVKSASQALVAIHKWVSAMLSYHELLKIVGPKREKVAEMNAKLAVVRASLAEKRKKLREVEEKIEGLERMYKEKVELEANLQKQIGDCMIKLDRAGKIISGLEGEKTRWTQTVERLEKEFGLLIGNSLVAAGMVAYSGAFTAQFRTELEH
jgi:dynein heavy chain